MALISKTVNVKGNPSNMKRLQELDYKIEYGKDCVIKVEHLGECSRNIVEAQCDVCGAIVNRPFNVYLKSYNIGSKFACSSKCGSVKMKQTNLENLGVEFPTQNKCVQEKKKQTCIERYGVEHPLQNKEIQDKFKQTCLENHGVEFPLSSPKIQNKIKQTCLENYGVENPMQNKNIQDKRNETHLKKYGVEFSTQSKEGQDKRKQTCIERYGFESPAQNEDIKIKMINAMVDFPSNINQNKYFIEYIGNGLSSFNCDKGHTFEIHSKLFHRRNTLNIPLCTVCNPIGDSSSIKEKILQEYITSIYDGNIELNNRKVLGGKELDIYLPDLNIAFEFNGVRWHSEEYVSNDYHLSKTELAKSKGIRLIHIFEDTWIEKNEILKSQIKNWIGKTENIIQGRKTIVKEVSKKDSVKFLNENHIQGTCNSILNYGLYFNNELVSLMVFDKTEGRKTMEDGGWCLTRFANKQNTSVVGGASKLFNHFCKDHQPTRIVSYSDNSWSDGGLYHKLGFILIDKGKPDYKYVVNNQRVHKGQFRKDNLIKQGFEKEVNDGLTEKQIMLKRKIYRIYDCGISKFEMKKPI